MKYIDYSNQIQKEAILNECKGNLFEFLVAQGLASFSKLEDQFLLNQPFEFRDKLMSYEDLIRAQEPKLLTKLPVLSKLTVNSIWKELKLDELNLKQWKVIGKIVATNDNEFWNETDIVGIYHNGDGVPKHLALSLKLSKEHSYTNTKSAGAKSFITKYFGTFKGRAISFQAELNEVVDESFLMMGHQLYSMIDKDFSGSFNSDWSDSFSELPGELTPEMRSVVHQNYHRVALKLASILDQLKKKDEILFYNSLASLCGFGHSEIIQVSCFHQEYDFSSISIKKYEDFFSSLDSEKKCELRPLKDDASSVEIILGKIILQIRIKPMNKFTTAAYKINCSIKVKK